jgi:ketosteroid isomerase-like protein
MSTAVRTDAQIVRCWAEALHDRDLSTLLNLAHSDIECQPLKLSSRGVYRGRAGLAEWILDLMFSSAEIRVRIDDVKALSPERVAAFGTAVMDDEDISPYALVAIVRDGKIAAIRSYLNDEPTMERLGLLAERRVRHERSPVPHGPLASHGQDSQGALGSTATARLNNGRVVLAQNRESS